MNPEQFSKIYSIIPDSKLKNSFNLFHEKSVGDADIVARLEEKMKYLQKQITEADMSVTQRAVFGETLEIFRSILHDDKPNDMHK